MASTRTLLAATAVAVGSSAAPMLTGVAAADPVSPPAPLPAAQLPGLPGLPGLPAVEQLSPVIQQAASDPSGAASLLMAAAAAFTGNSAAPDGSKQVADALAQFLQSPAPSTPSTLPQTGAGDWPDTLPGTLPGTGTTQHEAVVGPAGAPHDPAAHIPTPGSEPGAVAHLPSGINPANAAGPAARALPAVAEVPDAPAVPDALAAPAAAASPAAAPAPDATPGFGPDSPPTQDFMYPSIGQGCLADGGNSIATALSVAGPAKIPTPGPGPGQTAYVFTAVGTPGPAETQRLPLNVTWVNLSTGRSGSATLKPRPDINPEGPTTLTAIVDTGSGSIISTIFGQVTTKEHQCNFIPTIGSTVVP